MMKSFYSWIVKILFLWNEWDNFTLSLIISGVLNFYLFIFINKWKFLFTYLFIYAWDLACFFYLLSDLKLIFNY